MIYRIFIVFLCFPCIAQSQVYQINRLFESRGAEFFSLEGRAWIDYNMKERYVELIFRDTLYVYAVKKARKSSDQHRFVVGFKNSSDLLFWNTQNPKEIFFSFRMRGVNFWFKDLLTISRDEFQIIKEKTKREK